MMSRFTLDAVRRLDPRIFICLAGAVLFAVVQLFNAAHFLQTYSAYSLSGLDFSDNARRTALIQKALRDPAILSKLDSRDVGLILQKPMMTRVEAEITSWHYHGDSCAIDIYFKDKAKQPEYVEFRALTLNRDVQDKFAAEDQAYLDKYCLKGVLEAQGVDTPSSYAARPLPSWKSPYSS